MQNKVMAFFFEKNPIFRHIFIVFLGNDISYTDCQVGHLCILWRRQGNHFWMSCGHVKDVEVNEQMKRKTILCSTAELLLSSKPKPPKEFWPKFIGSKMT